MNLDTIWLRDFIALAETQNFSQAANLRHVSQPAFSRRIQSLEAKLNCKLVNRQVQPIQLTANGQVLLGSATKIIDDIEQLSAQLDKDNISMTFAATHTLSLGVFPTIAQHINDLQLNIDAQLKVANADDCINLLAKKQCDCLLAFSDPLLAGYQQDSILLTKVKLLPVCIATEQGKPLFQLANSAKQVPYLAYQSNIYLGRVVKQLLANNKQKLNIKKMLEAPMADSLKMMAMKGLGVAWIPEFSVQQELSNKQLAIAGDARWQPELELRIYRTANNHNSAPKLEIIWQTLAKISI